MSSNSGSYSAVYNLSVPLNVKKQKNELSVSREKLLCDSRSASDENLRGKRNQIDDVELKEVKGQSTEKYILNKFFGHEAKLIEAQAENSGLVKPPVPKPRKINHMSPTFSQGTFEVTSPKIVRNSCDKGDTSSSTNRTYKVETVGDILIHQSPQPKVTLVKNYTQNLEKSDSEVPSEQATYVKQSKPKKVNDVKETNIGTNDLSMESIEHEARPVTDTKRRTILNEESPKRNYNYERIIEIVIHKTDRLKLDSFVMHPVVKLHVIDTTTGKYLSKSDKSRPVVFFYENADTSWISPVMTHTYNLQEQRILYPSWEENIILNEDFAYFKEKSSNIILFFEIVDFVSATTLNHIKGKDNIKGWHNIAFAFLKLSGKNGSMNICKKVRLQLYYSHHTRSSDPQLCNPWIWWKSKKLKQYPSTLYVTIKPTISPPRVIETFRSKTPIQRESSSKTKLCTDLQPNPVLQSTETVQTVNSNDTNLKAETITWSRNPKEKCKVPNQCFLKFNPSDKGCFVMKFSHNGLYLACGVQNESLFYIIIYADYTKCSEKVWYCLRNDLLQMSSFREISRIPSHQGLIYCIRWSSDDSLLLTASADNTVSIYALSSCSIFQVLPHPSFVYCCDINSEKLIATGCYDGTMRIWNRIKHERNNQFQLLQELEGHNGYVTSVCFNANCGTFSADSSGVIIEWQKEKEDWVLKRKITLLDLKETVINQIIIFPKGKKMLVHSRDSIIRIIDVKSGCVLQWLRGACNRRFQIFSCISPCGSYVFSGSENGTVHAWNSRSGEEVASYTPFAPDYPTLTIHCVEFHSHENVIAMSHYGKNVPVLLYHFDRKEQPKDSMSTPKAFDEKLEIKDGLHETKLKKYIKENYVFKNDEKMDFKSLLDKIDSVIRKSES